MQRLGAGAGRSGVRALNLYLDASALVKRYVAEPGSEEVRAAMDRADGWFMCRVGLVETTRAVSIASGVEPANAFREEWPMFGSIEVDQRLAAHAAELAVELDLRSLDALHLAAALILPRDGLLLATWDKRLHAAAGLLELPLLPAGLG